MKHGGDDMTTPNEISAVTLCPKAIHNPSEPRHFMRIKPVGGLVRIHYRGQVLAESQRALRLLEVGKDFYDPTIYLPMEDVSARLIPAEKRSYCPLKGHAGYFDLASDTCDSVEPEIAWSYDQTESFASELEGYVSFYSSRVTVEEQGPSNNASD